MPLDAAPQKTFRWDDPLDLEARTLGERQAVELVLGVGQAHGTAGLDVGTPNRILFTHQLQGRLLQQRRQT